MVSASESGSIEVSLGGSATSLSTGVAIPVAVPAGAADESQPIPAVVPPESSKPTTTRGERRRAATAKVTGAVGDAVGETVGKVGDGVVMLGEGVSKIGDATSKVPFVGAGMTRLGDGMQAVGGSLHDLSSTAKTRRGRLLVRSMVVGFLLVATWIIIIVMFQVRGTETVDFRPAANDILTRIAADDVELVYEGASPRFHEMVRKERFVDDMKDLRATVGEYREIAAVNDTLVTSGPSGRVGRVSLTVVYEKARCKASVSFHQDAGAWKLLGFAVELPPELEISQQQREERIAACKDNMSPKTCDLNAATVAVLEALRDDRAGEVWDNATPVFQRQEERARFVNLQKEHRERLGKFRRIIAVSEAKTYGGTSAIFDTLVEYEKSSGVRATLSFSRTSRSSAWKLRSLKVVLPMPRAADVAREAFAPHDAGVDAPPR